jgi:hypothetical protein
LIAEKLNPVGGPSSCIIGRVFSLAEKRNGRAIPPDFVVFFTIYPFRIKILWFGISVT